MNKQEVKELLLETNVIDEDDDVLEMEQLGANCYKVRINRNLSLMLGDNDSLMNYFFDISDVTYLFQILDSKTLSKLFGLPEVMFSDKVLEQVEYNSEMAQQICDATNKDYTELFKTYFNNDSSLALSSRPEHTEDLSNGMIVFPIDDFDMYN